MITKKFVRRLIFSVIQITLIFGALLFAPAWTMSWWRAWAFVGVAIAGTITTMVCVFPGREELLNERVKPVIQKGQPLADKVIMVLYITAFIGLVVFIPLDVFRFQLISKPSVMASSFGLVLIIAGWIIISLALRENAFAAPVIKYQKERRHKVVDTGLYGVVRHPIYAGGAFFFIGVPLWLESYAGALLAIIPISLLILRIFIEERFLRQNLDGYEAYLKRVRYRLVPYLW
jgi:protein-S-isoprenylcysteine O-methyltransferase Ste14